MKLAGWDFLKFGLAIVVPVALLVLSVHFQNRYSLAHNEGRENRLPPNASEQQIRAWSLDMQAKAEQASRSPEDYHFSAKLATCGIFVIGLVELVVGVWRQRVVWGAAGLVGLGLGVWSFTITSIRY